MKRRALCLLERMPAVFLQLGRNVERRPGGRGAALQRATGGLLWLEVPGRSDRAPVVSRAGAGDPVARHVREGERAVVRWARLRSCASSLDRAAALAGRRGYLAWEYLFSRSAAPARRGPAAWRRARASRPSRAGRSSWATPAYLEIARQALGAFETPRARGRRRSRPRAAATTSCTPTRRACASCNGFLQALVGVRDFATGRRRSASAGDLRGWGHGGQAPSCPRFDTGAWSLYARGGAESSLSYHELVTGFLGSLCTRTSEAAYCEAQARFARYTREPPRRADLVRGPPPREAHPARSACTSRRSPPRRCRCAAATGRSSPARRRCAAAPTGSR